MDDACKFIYLCGCLYLIIILKYLQEGPSSISVFGMEYRTNNLVESHNARLSQKLGSRAPFFRFVLALAKKELRKTVQFLQIDNLEGVFN